MNLGILALMLPMAAGAPVEAMPPPPIPSAFTYVQVIGPEGSTTTWYPGTAAATKTADGATAALRPGYCYRFELGSVGDRKNSIIWPSIEVRGTLIHRPQMNVADHPIKIVLSEEDVARILEGRFLSKVYFLEDPAKSVNGAQPPGIPLETSSPTEIDAVKDARSRGRLMLIVRAGERLWTREELAYENVPGSIWLPGMKNIPAPIVGPRLPYGCIPLYDPISGPKLLSGECLHDGGDLNNNLGIGKENRVYGLNPSDSAIEFNTPAGKKVVPSNRVCICIPRYAAQRVEIAPIGHHGFRGPEIRVQAAMQRMLVHKLPSGAVMRIEQPIGSTGRLRPSGLLAETYPLTKDTFTGRIAAVANFKGTQVAAQVREPEDITVSPDCTLVLMKRMDPPNPKQIGEIVTFFLSYRNTTLQPMTDVVISDSLTGRLEYVEGSARSDRATTFTSAANEAGSLLLRWSVDEKLLPGQSGVVSFRAKIR